MPIFNVVKKRTDWVEYTIEADTYDDAMDKAKYTSPEYGEVEYDEWEIVPELGGRIE